MNFSSWPAVAFSAGGDGGRKAPEYLAQRSRFMGIRDPRKASFAAPPLTVCNSPL
jgi:hypothetical protein